MPPETTAAPEWLPSSDKFKKIRIYHNGILGERSDVGFYESEVEAELAAARYCITDLRERLAATAHRAIRKPAEVFDALLAAQREGSTHSIEMLRDELQASIVLAFLRGHA